MSEPLDAFAASIPDWPDDGLRHRIQLAVEVPSGPGVEIVAAQLLLDVVQTLTNQGLIPSSLGLRIAPSPCRAR